MPETDTKALLDTIDRLSLRPEAEIRAALNERKTRELEFHDRDRDRRQSGTHSAADHEKLYGNRKYYRVTERSHAHLQEWIAREARGRVFLDYACGNGGQAIRAALDGAALSVGFDISGVSVENARAAAQEAGVADRTRFFQADCEDTGLPDDAFDVVLCSGMLHHLDLSFAIPELRRIVRPGGRVLAVEALDYNPAIKLYRRLTPAMRTDWEKEHILDLDDVRFIERFFDVERIHYWHITGYVGGKLPYLFPVLDRLDRVLEKIPYVQRLAWMFSFELRKRSE